MQTLAGKRYIFRLDTKKDSLTIIAVCKRTKRHSHINNLNTILSEFRVDLNQRRFHETTWQVTDREKKKFVRIFRSIVQSPFLDYLEQELDVDRECGEWANKER